MPPDSHDEAWLPPASCSCRLSAGDAGTRGPGLAGRVQERHFEGHSISTNGVLLERGTRQQLGRIGPVASAHMAFLPVTGTKAGLEA